MSAALLVKAAVRPLPIDDNLESALAAAILRAVKRVRDATRAQEIEDAILDGDVQGALDAIKIELGTAVLDEVIPQALRSAFETAALTERDRLQRALGAELRVSFDLLNPEAIAWIRDRAAELITKFGDSSLEAIRSLILNAYRTGATPRELARTIRESGIGLTERQLRALENYRLGLLESKVEFTEAEVDAKVAAYGRRLLRQRARLIARTETHRAAAEGNRELWRQAKERGLLDGRARVQWRTTGQENVCPICDELDGEMVEVGGIFSSGVEGPPLHPACSCVAILLPFGGAA